MVRAVCFAIAVAVAIACAAPLAAVDYYPTRYDDPAPNGCSPTDCSLREAVIAANGTVAKDRIFLTTGIYQLTIAGTDENGSQTGDLDVGQDLDILGAAANLTFIYSDGIDRLIDVLNETTDFGLYDVNLIGGKFNDAGGAVAVSRATAVIERCDIGGNEGQSIVGATLFATLTLRDTTIGGNSGDSLSCGQSTCTLENVTLTQASTTREIQVSGGGELTCRHCTVFDSGTDTVISVGGAGSSASFANSAVQGQCLTSDSGTITSLGGNLESGADTCNFDQSGDVNGALSPGLNDLDSYGGGTRTMLPQDDGPSDNTALDANCTPSTDQIGFPRPATDCDRGATETGEPRPDTPLFIDGFNQGDPNAWEVFD